MIIKVLSCVENLKKYAASYSESNCEDLWEKLVVEPYWDKLCCYSPIDLSDRKPLCIRDIDALQKQILKFDKLNYIKIEEELTLIANKLPNYDDDPITVMIFPLDDNNEFIKEKQNGVIGTSLFGNIMIQVNPLAKDYDKWIKYVFAHEYHHTVWGNYWFNMHGNELKNNLLQALVIDGEADSFAMTICEDLKPRWLYLNNEGMIEKLYLDKYLHHLFETEFDYCSLMFGDEEKGVCWCGGYAVGYRIVQNFLIKNKINFSELIEINPMNIIV